MSLDENILQKNNIFQNIKVMVLQSLVDEVSSRCVIEVASNVF